MRTAERPGGICSSSTTRSENRYGIVSGIVENKGWHEEKGVKKVRLIAVFLWIGAAAAQAAWAAADKEIDELFALYNDHKNVYDACYELSVSNVLTGSMREELLNGAADRKKAMACVLAITSREAGIRITDIASLQKLRDYSISKVKCVEAEVDLRNARTALEMYYLDKAKYPETLEEIPGAYVVSFKSKMTYRLEADPARYVISATNKGCGKTLFISSDSTDIGGAGKNRQ
jgi:hypothetical protein